MPTLSAILYVVDSDGNRVDQPQADGTYLPVVLEAGENVTATATNDGSTTKVALASTNSGGTVTEVSSADTAIDVATGTTTPVLTLAAASGGQRGSMSAADYTKLGLYPAISGLTTGQVPRATGSGSVAFGALDLANTSAVTGTLAGANMASATATVKGAVPTPPNDATKVLLGNVTWGAAPGGSGAVYGTAATILATTPSAAGTTGIPSDGLFQFVWTGSVWIVSIQGWDPSGLALPPLAAHWTHRGFAGSTSISDVGGFPLLQETSAATTSLRAATEAIPGGGTWTKTAVIFGMTSNAVNNPGFGIGFWTGSAVTGYYRYNAASGATRLYDTASAGPGDEALAGLSNPIGMRVSYSAASVGTEYTLYYSTNGIDWWTHANVSKSSLGTPTEIGILVESQASAMLLSWV